MPMQFSDIGGVAATFSVTDDFTDPLARAQTMLRDAAKAAAAFSAPAKRWSAGADAIGASATTATPKLYSLARAATDAAEAISRAFTIAAARSDAMSASLRKAADAFVPFRSASTLALGTWTKLDAQIERSSGLLDTAGNKMAFAATSARTMAAETAEIAASAQATAKAAAATAAAVNKMRPPRMLAAPGGEGGGRMPPVRPPGGGGDESFGGGGEAGGFIAGRLSKVGTRIFSIPALGAGFTAYEALKAALATTYDVTKTAELYDVASIKNPKLLAADKEKLLSLAFQSAQGTIFSAQETANAYGILAPILATAPAFQGPHKWENFRDLAPIVLRASEVAAMNGLGPLKDDMIAMAWYAHLTGAYTPQSMTAASDQLLAIAERTGVKLPRLEKIASYALPVARGLGVSVSDTAMLVGALIQGGLGQRAGYAVGQILTGLLQTGGPVTAALQKALETLGVHGVTYKGKQLKAHQAGLHTLGLLDQSGKLTVLDTSGHVSLPKVVQDIEDAAKRLSPTAFANAVQAAFGIRGARGADILPALEKLLPAFEKSVETTPTALQQQAAFAATTQQQLEQVIARVKDVATILGIGILPVLNGMLDVLLPILGDIDSVLGQSHAISSILGGAAAGAGAGFLIAGPLGAAVGAGLGAVAGGVGYEADNGLLIGPKERISLGKPVFAVPLSPSGTINNYHVTVNAPGADGPTIANHVTNAIHNMQKQNQRRGFQDRGLAFPGGAQ